MVPQLTLPEGLDKLGPGLGFLTDNRFTSPWPIHMRQELFKDRVYLRHGIAVI